MKLYRVQRVSANRPSSGKNTSVTPCTQDTKDKVQFVLTWNKKKSAVNAKWTKKQQRTTTLAPGKAMMTQLGVVVTDWHMKVMAVFTYAFSIVVFLEEYLNHVV